MLNELDLNKLNVFLEIVEAGGVTAAARRLALTPSAVSQSLSSLEASLAVPLFHRVGRRLLPTREGERLHAGLREYQDGLAAALAEVVNPERHVRGTVRLGLFPGFSRVRLSQVVAQFAGAHPDAQVRVAQLAQDELESRLLAGALDFTVSFTPRSRRRRALRSTRLLQQELVLVAARRLVRRPQRLADLGGLPLVDYYPSAPLVQRWARHHFGRPLPDPDVRAWAATTDLVLELILAGVGGGVLPRDLAAPHLRRRLGVIEAPGDPLRDIIWLNELRSPKRSPLLDAFRAALLATA